MQETVKHPKTLCELEKIQSYTKSHLCERFDEWVSIKKPYYEINLHYVSDNINYIRKKNSWMITALESNWDTIDSMTFVDVLQSIGEVYGWLQAVEDDCLEAVRLNCKDIIDDYRKLLRCFLEEHKDI